MLKEENLVRVRGVHPIFRFVMRDGVDREPLTQV